MTSKKLKILASLACLAAATIFGFGFVVVKNSLDAIPASYMVGIRGTLAALFLGIFFCKKLRLITPKAVFYGFLLGLSFGLGYLLQAIGLEYTTAGKSAFLTSAYIIVTPLCAFFLLKKRMDLYTLISAITGFVGIGFISIGSEGGFNVGDVITLVSGICFSLQLVFMEKGMRDTDPMLLTFLMFVFVAVVGWVSGPILHGPFKAEMINKDTIVSLLYLGLGGSGLALLFQSWGQQYLSSSQTALLLGFEAVFGALFGIIFLHETFTAQMLIGCALMACALVVSETKLTFIRKPLIGMYEKRKNSKAHEKERSEQDFNDEKH